MVTVRSSTLRLATAVMAGLLVVGVFGCARSGSVSSGNSGATQGVVPPVVPKAPDLRTPESAVKSYTDWISFAYRVSDSDVATSTFTVYEEVRVNSYVQFNKIEGRAIEQMLAESKYRRVASSDTTVTLAGSEYWRYRYLAADETKYLTSPTEASYDVTYTVQHQKDGKWLVHRVEVTGLDEQETQD